MRIFHPIQAQKTTEFNQVNSNVSTSFLCVIVSTAIIITFGLTLLYSITVGSDGNTLFNKQLTWLGVGGVAGLFMVLMGPKRLTSWHFIVPIILGIWALLLVAAFCFPPIKGAYRWIIIPGVGSIQPSEIAKFACVLLITRWCSDHLSNMEHIVEECFFSVVSLFKFNEKWTYSVKKCWQLNWPLVLFVITVFLVFLGRDLGMTVLIISTAGAIIFFAGLRWRWLVLSVFLAGISFYLVLLLQPWRFKRIVSFLDPEALQDDKGYQIWNSLLALGSGGWTGQGFGEGRFKQGYLPEDHTDCILSIAGEEWGYIVLLGLLLGFVVLFVSSYKIAISATSKLSMLLAAGFTTLLTLQILMNLAVITSVVPPKGMPAPFISYGGSDLVISIIAISVVLSVAKEIHDPGFHLRVGENIKARLFIKEFLK